MPRGWSLSRKKRAWTYSAGEKRKERIAAALAGVVIV